MCQEVFGVFGRVEGNFRPAVHSPQPAEESRLSSDRRMRRLGDAVHARFEGSEELEMDPRGE